MKKELCIKKALAMVLMLVFSLSCVISAPKVKATTSEKPAVTLDGASIRTEEEKGKQGLRFHITVTDAANVTACGIELAKSSNAQSPLDIGTANTNFRKIYKRTVEDDGSVTVEYVAAVTDIPDTDFTTDIYAKGYIVKKDGKKVYTTELERNIKQVADSAGYIFDKNGDLIRKGLPLVPTSGRGVGIIKGLNTSSRIYSDKDVHIRFDVRMEGNTADGNETLNIIVDPGNGNTKVLGTVDVTNDWTHVNIDSAHIPTIAENGEPCIYLAPSDNNSDMSNKNFFVKARYFEVLDPNPYYEINFEKGDNTIEEGDLAVRGNGTLRIEDAPTSASQQPNKYLVYTRDKNDPSYSWEAYPIMKIKLPSGKKLSDYANFSFNQMGIEGDIDYKPIHVAITKTLDEAKTITNCSQYCLGDVQSPGGKNVWGFFSNYKFPSDNRTDLNEFYLIIRTHASSYSNGACTKFAIDNIRFYEKTQ